MRNDICTIPINEAFEDKKTCPLCYMYKTLEDHLVDYIMGAAMMEPDVRIETNRLGFCRRHFDRMLAKGNRLSLALILDSRLKELSENLKPSDFKGKKGENGDTCFVCDKIEWGFSRMINQIYSLYNTEEEFREIFDSHGNICMPHAKRLISQSKGKIKGKNHSRFCENTYEICNNTLKNLIGDIGHFTSMYDYRNRGGDFGESKDSPERAINWSVGI